MRDFRNQTPDTVCITSMTQLFKAVNSYVERYLQDATYRFWVWKLERDLRLMGVSKEEMLIRLAAKNQVIVVMQAL